MRTNNKTTNYSQILSERYGQPGTSERLKFEDEARDFYASQIILQSRKESRISQKVLAEMAKVDKSYISRIETGAVQPTVSTFLKIIGAMGKSLEVT